MIEINVID